MVERVEIKIVGDESSAQAALRRSSSAVSDAANQMRQKLGEIRNTSRDAFSGMGREANEGAGEVNQSMGRVRSTLDGMKAHFSTFIDGFKRGWREADDEIKRVARSAEQARQGMGQVGGGGGGIMGGAMAVFKGGILLEIASRLKDVGVATIETSAEFERLRSVLDTLEGAGGGAGRFAELKKFGTETPFELKEVVGAFAMLKAQGLDPSNAALRAYGNTASAMGKSLDQMVQAVADAAMGEFERLKEFGIKAVDAGDSVIMNFNGQATTIKKNSADIQAYLQQIGNVNFAGAMDRQMDTLGGKFSNLSDAAANFADGIGQGGLSQALKEAMDTMTGATGSSEELARGLGMVLGEAVRGVTEIVRTASQIFSDTFNLIKQIVTDSMGKSAGEAFTFGNIMKFVASLVSAAADIVQWAFQIIYTAVQSAINAFTTYWTVVDRAMSLDFSGMTAAVEDGMNRQVNIFRNGWNRIVDINDKGQARLKNINSSNNQDPVGNYASEILSELRGESKPRPSTSISRPSSGGGSRSGGASAAPSKMDGWRNEYQDKVLEEERAGRDTVAFAAQFWREKLALTKSGTKEQLQIRRELTRSEIALERQQQREQISVIRDTQAEKIEAAQSEIAMSRLALQEKIAQIEQERQLGAISDVEAIQRKAEVNRQMALLDQQLEQRQFDAKLSALKQQQMLYARTTIEYRNHTRQIELLTRQHDGRMNILDRQRQMQIRRDLASETLARRQSMQGIATSWAGQLARMATLQQGFMTTIKGLWGGLTQLFEQAISRILQQWILMLLVKETTSQSFHMKEVMRQAKQAAASAFASVAKIPIVGPALAPIAAAAAFAATIAFSAKDGYDVPAMAGPGVDGRGGQLGVVHPREMVLPADLADKIRGGGMGGMTVNISALDGKDVKRVMLDNKGALGQALRKYARDGGR